MTFPSDDAMNGAGVADTTGIPGRRSLKIAVRMQDKCNNPVFATYFEAGDLGQPMQFKRATTRFSVD